VSGLITFLYGRISLANGHQGSDTGVMAHDHLVHEGHDHQHKQGCGHTAIHHNAHVDYLHDGHLHFVHENHVDEHSIEVSGKNPNRCTPDHKCDGHDSAHRHGRNCGHEAVPHGDHVDYLVNGHLHHPDGEHCDDHGIIEMAHA
jgi:hypothetical protein